jgi:hypothetical protein
VKFTTTGTIPQSREFNDYNDWAREVDSINKLADRDFIAKAYLSKRGKGAPVSKDGTISVKQMGLYEGVDLSIRELLLERVTYKGLRMMEETKEDGKSYFTLSTLGTGDSDIPHEELRRWFDEYVQKELLPKWDLLTKKLEDERGSTEPVREDGLTEQIKRLEDELDKLVGSFRPLPVRISSEISVEIPGRREPQPTL